jgi:hypothetical protein
LLWVAESVTYVTGTGGTLVPGRAPRLFAYDRFGRRNTTFTLPFQPMNWLPTMSYDGISSLYIHNYAAATYRLDVRTRVLTTLPTLSISVNPGNMAFYANSIWFKDRGNVVRYSPSTGQLLGSWAWPSAGSTVPQANNVMRGFVSAGFGQFWVAGGTSPNLRLVLVDSGLRSWLSVAPESLNIIPGNQQSLTLTLHGDRVSAGTFSTQLVFLSNDADARTVAAPVTFVVSNAAPALLTPTRAPSTVPSAATPTSTASSPRQSPVSGPIQPPQITRTSFTQSP